MDEHRGDHDDLIARLGGLAEPIHPARQASDLAAMAAAVTPRRGLFASKVRVAAAFLAGLLLGSTGLAAADVLPDPAQHVAHQVLDRVGVQVPDPERYHGPECGATAKRNHGAYVRDDSSLAQSECGKPVKAVGQGADRAPGQAKAAKGPCQGRPPWAGSTMTPEAKAAAQAEREAACPDGDAAEVETDDEDEAVERDAAPAEPEPTTTTEAPTTTTTVETTTTTAASTTPTAGS